jgi:hypothetical protein
LDSLFLREQDGVGGTDARDYYGLPQIRRTDVDFGGTVVDKRTWRVRPATAPDTARPQPAADTVFEVYTTSEDGPTKVRNRFLRLSNASLAHLLPDTAFCGVYFASHQATYCFRDNYGEPFQTRRIDAFSVGGSADASALVKSALESLYPRIRNLFFPMELVTASGFQCVSFSVNEVLAPIDSITREGFRETPRGVRMGGLACNVDGQAVALVDSTRGRDYGVWDSFVVDRKRFLIVMEEGYEYSAFQLYKLDGSRLVLVQSMGLYSGG